MKNDFDYVHEMDHGTPKPDLEPSPKYFLWKTQFSRNTATMDEWRNLKRILEQGYFDRDNSGIDAYYMEGGSSSMAASAKRISTPAS